jgi:mono/diheme cytochrome c family protein
VRRLAVAGLALGLAGAAQGEELGRKVFNELAQPPCQLCHALKAAGAAGSIGPSLDELKPDLQQTLAAVRQGVGVMPSFDGKLTAAQIEAVARYVATVAGK